MSLLHNHHQIQQHFDHGYGFLSQLAPELWRFHPPPLWWNINCTKCMATETLKLQPLICVAGCFDSVTRRNGGQKLVDFFNLFSWWNVCCRAEAGSWQPITMCMTALFCRATAVFQKCIIVNNLHIHAQIKTTHGSHAAMRVLHANISADSTQ